ncbi:spindle pole body-associated protein [Rhynchospora pubera]|uniref:Spindle pole body-associated protein n=1 Tax=Rhynchospora pubera TaxID=906938 RepID=A0AAV8D908_9POAL|nr:spindle pole body-associated protein [Rhynchospora pubera]
MGALSLLPSPLVSLQSNPVRASPVRPYLIPRRRVLSHWKGHVTVRANREAERPGGAGGESLFFDENGVVDDMDGYLNYLSLEYDSVWDTKPAWCQPWTILLTGVTVIVCSWLIFHSIVLSSGAFALISAWWYIFLYSYSKVHFLSEHFFIIVSGFRFSHLCSTMTYMCSIITTSFLFNVWVMIM